MRTHLFVSKTGDGWRNLAMEEYLMDHTGPDDATVFFYVNDSAVIIGRSQNPWAECNLAMMDADGVQLVRRISGGGAVYHDQGNLNFSFIMGKNRYDHLRQLGIVFTAIRAFGVECEFSGRNDLLVGGRKFSGNAYCKRGQAKLHHGTLLVNSDLERLQTYLNVDVRKLYAKGTKSVRSRVCNLSEYVPGLDVDVLLSKLMETCRLSCDGCELLHVSEIDSEVFERYYAKHASVEWRLGETPKFDYEIENRFAWGNAQLLLRLRGGIIEGLDVYTDANDAELAERIRRRLEGVPFGSESIARALRANGDEQMNDLAEYVSQNVTAIQ